MMDFCSYCDGTPIEDHGYCKPCLERIGHLCSILGIEIEENMITDVLERKVKENPIGGKLNPPKPISLNQELSYFPYHPRANGRSHTHGNDYGFTNEKVEPIDNTVWICGLYVPI